MSYDSWKLATPPEYEEGSPDPVDEVMAQAEEIGSTEDVISELEKIAQQYPRLRDKADSAIRSLRGGK